MVKSYFSPIIKNTKFVSDTFHSNIILEGINENMLWSKRAKQCHNFHCSPRLLSLLWFLDYPHEQRDSFSRSDNKHKRTVKDKIHLLFRRHSGSA